jgi:hypothetical protein
MTIRKRNEGYVIENEQGEILCRKPLLNIEVVNSYMTAIFIKNIIEEIGGLSQYIFMKEGIHG